MLANSGSHPGTQKTLQQTFAFATSLSISQPIEQSGFRSRCNTCDHLQTMNLSSKRVCFIYGYFPIKNNFE